MHSFSVFFFLLSHFLSFAILSIDNAYINYNKPLVDCFKKSNLVTFASNHKVELICSDDDHPINITLVPIKF